MFHLSQIPSLPWLDLFFSLEFYCTFMENLWWAALNLTADSNNVKCSCDNSCKCNRNTSDHRIGSKIKNFLDNILSYVKLSKHFSSVIALKAAWLQEQYAFITCYSNLKTISSSAIQVVWWTRQVQKGQCSNTLQSCLAFEFVLRSRAYILPEAAKFLNSAQKMKLLQLTTTHSSRIAN